MGLTLTALDNGSDTIKKIADGTYTGSKVEGQGWQGGVAFVQTLAPNFSWYSLYDEIIQEADLPRRHPSLSEGSCLNQTSDGVQEHELYQVGLSGSDTSAGTP